jgi:MOSC domain-containing protein YiiM
MIVTPARLLTIQTGRVAPLGPDGVPSGFVKSLCPRPLCVGLLGLEGDAQADLRVHGGPEKAVYGYAASHYPAWQAEFPEHAALLTGGGVGENLTIAGMDESNICVGDIHAIGSALLQVCQIRQPCFKFALRFGDSRLPKAMVRNGRSGWYYRVLEPGVIQPDDAVALHDRPNPDFGLARFAAIVYRNNATLAELERLADMAGLASQWQARTRKALGDTAQLNPNREFP